VIRHAKPKVDRRDPRIEQMVNWLRGRGWITRALVFQVLGVADRQGRILKSLSRGRIISGNNGYRLTVEATDAEWKDFETEALEEIETLTKYLDDARKVRAAGKELATPNTSFAPLADPVLEELCQKVFGYAPEQRAAVLAKWMDLENENRAFASHSPEYKQALKLRECRVRLLRLIELENKTAEVAA